MTRWRPIPRYEGYYEVSDDGAVRSIDRTVQYSDGRVRNYPSKPLSPKMHSGGYLLVNLWKNNKGEMHFIHRLVLLAFRGTPDGNSVCCHNNDIKTDNRLENLRWDTQSENLKDAVRNGNHAQSNKTHCKYGHEFTEENTYRSPSNRNGRWCRKCMKIRQEARIR